MEVIELKGRKGEMNFTDLHLHSTYSCLDAFGTPQQIVQRAKALGRTAIALTDHGSISGYVQFAKECKEKEIKPIFGYEAYIVNSIPDMFEKQERKKSHITLLAENEQGYRNILKLASLAYEKGFYYFPTIDWKMLCDNSEGIILLSGCWSSHLQRLLIGKEEDAAGKLVDKMKEIFGDRLFLETQHYSLFQDTFKALTELSRKKEVPIVLTCDSHFMTDGQAPLQEILHSVRERRQYDANKLILDAYQWPVGGLWNLIRHRFGEGWEQIFDTVNVISERCNVEMIKGSVPHCILTEKQTAANRMIDLCKEGIVKRKLVGAGLLYRERFLREKKVIEEKGFIDYLLIVADLVQWAKSQGIFVGPGRGSAAGSLICYLLGITEVNPIKHGLLFERFIDESRYDLPDIDTDFESDKRDLVKEYVMECFGRENVCDVATFARFRGKNSLDEIGKVFSIPSSAVGTVKKFLVTRSTADMRAQITIQDTFEMSPEAKKIAEIYPNILKACEIEGQLRHLSTHAAGIIVSNNPLSETIAVYERNKRKISSFEMKDASTLGMVKIDLLGVMELSVLRQIADLVGMKISDIYSIPLDDSKTLEGFKQNNIEGIFQFEGDSTRGILKQMSHVDFEQLAACLSLSKPGPAHSGSTVSYLSRMNGDAHTKAFDWHPLLADITKKTYGQIIYQEQIIRILRELADFSVTDANQARVVVAKSQGEQEFEKYFPAFSRGIAGKVSEDKAKELWNSIKIFGRYCFNRSHAVSYALLAFWSMYMKEHYPMEFYLVKLNNEAVDAKKVRLLIDARNKGIIIAPPLIGKSGSYWKIENENILQAGLLEIKGIGAKIAERLIQSKNVTKKDFENKKVKGVSKKVIQILEDAGALEGSIPVNDFFGINRYDILKEIAPKRKLIKNLDDQISSYQTMVAGIFTEMNYKDIFEERRSKGRSVENIGSSKKAKYAHLLLEDETDRCLIIIDRFLFAKCGDVIWEAFHNGNFVVVWGEKLKGWRMISTKKFAVYNKDGQCVGNYL